MTRPRSGPSTDSEERLRRDERKTRPRSGPSTDSEERLRRDERKTRPRSGPSTRSDADRALLSKVIAEIEKTSRAEIVLAMRSRSAVYERGPVILGAAVSSGTLSFLLFSPWEFTLNTIALAPMLAGAAVALLGAVVPAFERALSRRRVREEAVQRAARATFVERGVSQTRERTGILIYVSLLERRMAAVADKGVTDVIPPDVWGKALEPLEEAAAAGGRADVLAPALQSMAGLLARALPARADDLNELPDAVQAAS